MIIMINVFEPPMIYFLFLGVILGVGIIVFRKIKSSEKGIERFKGQTLNEVIEEENLKPYIRSFGRKTKNGKMINQINSIPIRRVVKAKFKYADVKKTKGIKNITIKEGDFYVFQSGKSFLVDIPLFNKLVGKPEYYVVSNNEDTDNDKDKIYITKDKFRDVWVCNPNTFFYSLGGVWINSDEGRNFITELVYKKTYENLKEEDMNYVKRIVWYNDMYASKMTGREQDYDLEKRKWEDRVQRETGTLPQSAS